jgi:hypothetical protein
MRRSRGLAILVAVIALGVSSSAMAASARAALNQKMPEVKFQGQGLRDCMDFLRDVSGANLHVNWRALEAAGVTPDTPVNVRLRDVSLRKVLTVLLSEAAPGTNLTFYTSEGVIEVTTSEIADAEMITRVYPVEDLLIEVPDFNNAPDLSLFMNQASTSGGGGTGGGMGGGGYGGGGGGFGGGGGGFGGGGGGLGGGGGGFGGGSGGGLTQEKIRTKQERADDLVTLIRETIRPEIWKENGGTAAVRYYNGNLIVTAPRSVHEAIGGPVE